MSRTCNGNLAVSLLNHVKSKGFSSLPQLSVAWHLVCERLSGDLYVNAGESVEIAKVDGRQRNRRRASSPCKED